VHGTFGFDRQPAKECEIQQGWAQYSKIGHNTVRLYTIQQDWTQYSKIGHNTARLDTIQQDWAQYSKIGHNSTQNPIKRACKIERKKTWGKKL
jgi:hypothetical protein